jgi:hypothetical protein
VDDNTSFGNVGGPSGISLINPFSKDASKNKAIPTNGPINKGINAGGDQYWA